MSMAVRVTASIVLFISGVAITWFVGAGVAQRRTDPVPVECIGDANARSRAVYLHGLDSFGPSWQELGNRRVLAQLAREHGLRIALPRGPMCGSGRCWPYQGEDDQNALVSRIEGAAEACFGAGANYGVVGFSNGGFAAAEIFETCRLSQLDWIILSGSGGHIEPSHTTSLADCGKIAVVIGDRDRHHWDIAHNYDKALRDRGADARLIEYQGGHRLAYSAMVEALSWATGEAQ